MLSYTCSTCLECGQPFDKCICQQRFETVVDPETAEFIFSALANTPREPCDMTGLTIQVDKLVRDGRKWITALGLCYELDHDDPDEIREALENLIALGVVEKAGGDGVFLRYRAVPGAPVLAIA